MTTPFRPMLAAAATQPPRWPTLVSPKLDGVRCIVRDGVALSRTLRPIPNAHVQALFGRPELNGLDGELIVGPANAADVFTRTQSGVMSAAGTPDVTLHVFDHTDFGGPFRARLQRAASVVAQAIVGGHIPRHALGIVPHTDVRAAHALDQIEARAVADGYEGIVLRDPAGTYKHGRCTVADGSMLKIKRQADAEARIVGADALRRVAGDTTSLLGALVVVDLTTGHTFGIGTGFTADERAALWRQRNHLAGRIVRYRYQPYGTDAAPRFPVFAGFRDAIDL